ncbi:hypothetical protein [uncultured Maritimibacter sp.]|jgi:hypothetical protein|uniref:hypothetical protein n=1 Tax=uncultured Maritimibacter sp. TaxID=991866 RepID=UPI002617AD9C|nr:hypothetical protein [uncultured Maritimibacter sp.]
MIIETYWKLGQINSRCTLAFLNEVADWVPVEHQQGIRPARKGPLIEWIRAAREHLWDSVPRDYKGHVSTPATYDHKGRGATPGPRDQNGSKRTQGNLCLIPASEVNAFLRSLPRRTEP